MRYGATSITESQSKKRKQVKCAEKLAKNWKQNNEIYIYVLISMQQYR